MLVQTYSQTRAKFKASIEAVSVNHEPLLITAKSGDVVMMAKSDYDSMQETMYLLSSTSNAKRLMKSIEQAEGIK